MKNKPLRYQKELAGKKITMAHGAGGRLTHELIQTIFKPAFSNKILNSFDDAAELVLSKERIAFTTDSFVIDPLFFPGGDIGRLALCGTINDLAMKGAHPVGISVAAIIEEGLDISILKTITKSIAAAAKEAGVMVVTGDTKVVEKGKADKLFLTTSGVGIIDPETHISGKNARAGDAVIISGTIADHGTAVLVARNNFKFKGAFASDCAPLNHLVGAMLSTGKTIAVLRDPTRGGVATTLHEIASVSHVGIIIEESLIPINPSVKNACNLLGLDPLYVANEGKLLAVVPAGSEPAILNAMKSTPYGTSSTVIGRVVSSPKGVWLKTRAGGLRCLAMLEGNQLPRIC
ncbi:MAG: hydrogenase expression/formation protein HypE [Endomicrobiales bacterium]